MQLWQIERPNKMKCTIDKLFIWVTYSRVWKHLKKIGNLWATLCIYKLFVIVKISPNLKIIVKRNQIQTLNYKIKKSGISDSKNYTCRKTTCAQMSTSWLLKKTIFAEKVCFLKFFMNFCHKVIKFCVSKIVIWYLSCILSWHSATFDVAVKKKRFDAF